MKYGISARVYSRVFTKLLREYYKENFPGADTDGICRQVKKEYREMVKRTPDIGGSSNQSNLTGACFFFAAAKTVPGMTPALMDDIVDKSMESELMAKLYRRKKEKGILFSEKTQNRKLMEAEKSHSSDYEMDWEFTYQKGKDEFYITYTKCGVCRLAEREHTENYLPCMCRMDYPKFALAGARLIRDKTLAAGDECCNFHVVKEQK